MKNIRKRVLALATATAVAATTAIATTPAQAASPAQDTAAWLTGELVDGLMPSGFSPPFDKDLGLTLDTAYSLNAVGGHGATVTQIRNSFEPRIGDYVDYVPNYMLPTPTADDTHTGAGQLAKALAFVQLAGGNGASYGGRNLLAELEGRTAADGRIEDKLAQGDTNPDSPGDQPDTDFANSVGQAFAARALTIAGSPEAAAARSFLLQQQCPAGFFREQFAAKGAPQQACNTNDAPATDVTALAVLQLVALPTKDNATSAAITKATAWLRATQRADGSFGTGPAASVSNTNSTGSAAWALSTQGGCADAGRAGAWVQKIQVRHPAAGSPLAGENGAVAFDVDTFNAAKTSGIAPAARYVWRRAGTQAAPGLLAALTANNVTFTGPTAFQRAGATAALSVAGVGEGERVCLTGPGITGERSLTGTGLTAPLGTNVVLPTKTATSTFTLVTATGTKTVAVKTLGKTTLKAKVKKKTIRKGKKQVIKVSGLEAGEKVVVRVAGKRVAKGLANANGVFKAKFKIKNKLAKPGKKKVKVFGQFKDLRKGKATFRVVR